MNVQRQIESLRTRRAAEWYESMTEGRAGQNTQFVAWIAESPRNLEEFLKIVALSQEVQAAAREPEFDRERLLQQAAANVSTVRIAPPIAAPAARSGSGRRWRVIAAAATIAALTMTALWTWNDLAGGTRYSTTIGEQRTVDLPDGSTIHLNSESRIRVQFEDSARVIRLLAGDALFRVAKDTTRPFRVRTRDALVQAVGTQFNVSLRADGTRVAVLEGRVQVLGAPGPSAQVMAQVAGAAPRSPASGTGLGAGEVVRVSTAGAIERRPAADAASAVAWRQRRLIFEGTSLEEAVREFNRYHRSPQLRLEDVPPGSHHYTGTFDADDPESFATLLSRERDLLIQRRNGEIVILERR